MPESWLVDRTIYRSWIIIGCNMQPRFHGKFGPHGSFHHSHAWAQHGKVNGPGVCPGHSVVLPSCSYLTITQLQPQSGSCQQQFILSCVDSASTLGVQSTSAIIHKTSQPARNPSTLHPTEYGMDAAASWFDTVCCQAFEWHEEPVADQLQH